MSKAFVWSIGRAAVVAGVAWIYSSATPGVDASCYIKCDSSKLPNGTCVSVKCVTDDKKQGMTVCDINEECDCDFSGSVCNKPAVE
jgi:uncharacterized low-complexity protein